MVDLIKEKEAELEKKIAKSAKALEKLFDEVVTEGIDYEVEMTKPSEVSEDTWGLKSIDGAYESSFSIDIIEDEVGNRKIKIYQ